MGLASGDVDGRLSAFHGRGQTAKNPQGLQRKAYYECLGNGTLDDHIGNRIYK